MANSQLTEKQIAHAVDLARARTEYAKKHGSPQLNNEEEVTLIALREYQESRKLLKAAERRIAELESKLSKPVLLPKTNGYWNEQEKAYEEAITLAKRQVRLAGFSVEDM
ncbi:hypothetical protein ACT9D3_003903 [Salmonella enterica subsp. diarizonae serovar 50:r:z]